MSRKQQRLEKKIQKKIENKELAIASKNNNKQSMITSPIPIKKKETINKPINKPIKPIKKNSRFKKLNEKDMNLDLFDAYGFDEQNISPDNSTGNNN